MEKTKNLTTGNIYVTLFKFAIPFLLANLLQALYGATDLFIVGRFSDATNTAAVATGSQVMQIITNLIIGITTGATVLVGQYRGARKEKEIAKAVGTIITMFAIIGVLLTAIMVIFINPIILLLNVPVQALIPTKDYILICSWGILSIIGYNAISGILRGLGDSKTPLLFVTIACVVNMFLDIIFGAVFSMGAVGAALSTSIGQGISFLLSIIYLMKKGFDFPFHKGFIKIFPSKMYSIFRLGLPIAFQNVLVSFSFLFITMIVNVAGVTATAAVGVVEKVIIFSMLPPVAFSLAVSVMAAQNVGANQGDRAQKSMYGGILFSLIFAVPFCLLAQRYGTAMTGAFSRDSSVIWAAASYLKSYSIDCVLVSFVFNMNAYFNGCGNTFFSMLHSILVTFLVRIPYSFLITKIAPASLYLLGFAAPFATAVSVVLCFIYLKRGRYLI